MATAKEKQGITVQVRRTFPASRERVFAAWAEREQVERWMYGDVKTHQATYHENDIRTGGRYRVEIYNPVKNETYWGSGVYLEVKPPEKIAFTWSWKKDTPGGPELHPESPDTQVTVEFFARGNSTEVVLTHGIFGSQAESDDHERGWNGCLDALANLLQVASTHD